MLNCWPTHCQKGHKQRGFCGQPLLLRLNAAADSCRLLGHFRTSKSPLAIEPGAKLSDKKIARLLREFAEGHDFHLREATLSQAEGYATATFEPGWLEWHYEWTSPTNRASKMPLKHEHCFTVYVLQH